jgi:hypothetical protein
VASKSQPPLGPPPLMRSSFATRYRPALAQKASSEVIVHNKPDINVGS